MDADCAGDANVWQVPALRHLVDRCAADSELGSDLADGQELLGHDDALVAPYGRPIRLVFCFVGRGSGWTRHPWATVTSRQVVYVASSGLD